MTILSLTEKDINEDGTIKSLSHRKDVTVLFITGQAKLTKLSKDKLPPSLTHLSIGGCRNISALTDSDLPHTVTHLDLNDCENLELLSISSLKLKSLVLSGCFKLNFTDHLQQALRLLKQDGCFIRYYSDVQDVEIKNKMEQLLGDTPNLYNLFNICFVKSSLAGTNKEGFVQDMSLLFNIIYDHPHKNLIEKIAGQFLTDEVDLNQKFAGFFKLSHLMLATSCITDDQRLEALRPLMVENVIRKFVQSICQTQGIQDSFTQNLLGNAFLKAVHEKFGENKDLSLAWIGIPQNLFPKQISDAKDAKSATAGFREVLKHPIQELISKFVTPENISTIYERAKSVLESPMQKNIDDFFADNTTLLGLRRDELDKVIKLTPSPEPAILKKNLSASRLNVNESEKGDRGSFS